MRRFQRHRAGANHLRPCGPQDFHCPEAPPTLLATPKVKAAPASSAPIHQQAQADGAEAFDIASEDAQMEAEEGATDEENAETPTVETDAQCSWPTGSLHV